MNETVLSHITNIRDDNGNPIWRKPWEGMPGRLNAAYTEKDRIVENIVFQFSLDIGIKSFDENETIVIGRYVQALDKTIVLEDFDNLVKKIILKTLKQNSEEGNDRRFIH